MITYLQTKLKQIFCRHKNTWFKQPTAIEKYHHIYGHVICCRCGKELKTINLDNLEVRKQ